MGGSLRAIYGLNRVQNRDCRTRAVATLKRKSKWQVERLCTKQGQKRAGAEMTRKTAASPAPVHAALACGNAACGKALGPPLLQCFKCKAVLLQGVPGGRPGRPRRAQRAVRIFSLTHARSLPPCLHPPAPVQGQSLDMRRCDSSPHWL